MSTPMTCVHAVIRGRVQGVWFRAWTQKTAQKLALRGWVRNCADGTVEAVFCGPQDVVENMVEQCRSGPLLARVVDVRATPLEGGAEENALDEGFAVR